MSRSNIVRSMMIVLSLTIVSGSAQAALLRKYLPKRRNQDRRVRVRVEGLENQVNLITTRETAGGGITENTRSFYKGDEKSFRKAAKKKGLAESLIEVSVALIRPNPVLSMTSDGRVALDKGMKTLFNRGIKYYSLNQDSVTLNIAGDRSSRRFFNDIEKAGFDRNIVEQQWLSKPPSERGTFNVVEQHTLSKNPHASSAIEQALGRLEFDYNDFLKSEEWSFLSNEEKVQVKRRYQEERQKLLGN
jgi:hypothetical protein